MGVGGGGSLSKLENKAQTVEKQLRETGGAAGGLTTDEKWR